MNSIEGKTAVGSPGSSARYQNAHRICADCLEKSNGLKYRALAIGNTFASYGGYCYVCEQKSHVAVVEFINQETL